LIPQCHFNGVVVGSGTFHNGCTVHPFGPGGIIFLTTDVVNRLETLSLTFLPG
jgi:hypothetical protein